MPLAAGPQGRGCAARSSRPTSINRAQAEAGLLDALDTAHDFPLPPRWSRPSSARSGPSVENDKAQGALSDEDTAKSEDELRPTTARSPSAACAWPGPGRDRRGEQP